MAENTEQTNIQRPEISPRKGNKSGFYYSFLTIVLVFCLAQIGFGAILNISKTIAYRGKISRLTKIRDAAEVQNQELKQDIKLFSATSSLEGIARNNLKMAGEDEVLLLINANQPQNNVKKKKKSKNKKHKKGNKSAGKL